MPFRRRHDGITVLERLEEVQIWSTIVTILTVCLVLPGGLVKQALMATILAMIQRAQDLRDALWGPLSDIDTSNSNRNIDSFTEEFLYRHMRFRKEHLCALYSKLNFPDGIIIENGITCCGNTHC